VKNFSAGAIVEVGLANLVKKVFTLAQDPMASAIE
jgi:hypothetical protein